MHVSQVLPHRSRQNHSHSLCARGIVMLKQERASPKLFGKHRTI
uniref:Uncharacterized protein n=1 Tax=Anguilla anguilla TaxID=7936 RepID=A0A0E9T4E7_ANGAN